MCTASAAVVTRFPSGVSETVNGAGTQRLPALFGVPWSVWAVEAGVTVVLALACGLAARRTRATAALATTR